MKYVYVVGFSLYIVVCFSLCWCCVVRVVVYFWICWYSWFLLDGYIKVIFYSNNRVKGEIYENWWVC